jgi:6-phosphogluconolactonase (cycloisomerase 2 family)
VIKLDDNGLPKTIVGKYDPNAGREMKAKHDKHVNHSRNDPEAQKERQADPHSHALVLDPIFGRIAYVPDLGKDVISEFFYDPEAGTLTLLGTVPSGIKKDSARGGALGPRYIEFHPTRPVAYVINELSCEVAVFEFDAERAKEIMESDGKAAGTSTLRIVQNIKTVPDAFPTELSTCGRISVHSSGSFVLAANRGHDSIAVFKVDCEASPGRLHLADIQHTRGRTPRHFKFDSSGQWLIAANQDTDSVSIFHFNVATGRLNWTGHIYHVPSPNFVETLSPELRRMLSDTDKSPPKRARLTTPSTLHT